MKAHRSHRGISPGTPWLALGLGALLSSTSPALADALDQGVLDIPDEKHAQATRATSVPIVDGVLDDPLWTEVPVYGGFIQHKPNEGEDPTYPTTFQVAWDDANLYMAIKLDDPDPEAIVDRIHRRDQDSNTDWAAVFIDGYMDRRTARFFAVNAGGVQQDGTVTGDSNIDAAWDAVWESAVQITEAGWQVELRIPLNALRFKQEGREWGFQVSRYITRLQEQSFWTFESLSDARFVSRFGALDGVAVEDEPLRLNVTPYATTIVSTRSAPEEPVTNDFDARAGVDMRYGITPQLNLDATVLPDFGQVEVDQAQINLTAFENFFPEKRPFFLEGADVFEHPGDNASFFYSRRIGAQGAEILGAAKLTGRTTSGLGVGLIEGVTGPLYEAYETDEGEARRALVAPTSNYAVGRVRQDFGGQSYVGAIATSVVRADEGFSDNGPDVDRSPVGYEDAYTGAVDFRLTDEAARYAATGLVGGSVTTLDGEVEKGGQVDVTLQRNTGEWVVGALHYDYATPDLDLNDMGFKQRTDQHNAWGWMQVRKLDGLGPLRQVRLNLNVFGAALATQGVRANAGTDDGLWMQLPNFSWVEVGGGYGLGGYDPYEARSGPEALFLRPPEYWAWVAAGSNPRRPVIFEVKAVYGYDYFGGEAVNLSPSMVLQVGKRGEFELGGYGRLADNEVYWVETTDGDPATDAFEPEPIFGRQATVQGDLYHRGMITFTRDVSLQYFTQFQFSKVDWREYYLLGDDGVTGVDALDDYTPGAWALARANYAFFQANVRLRWQYRPGSEIYLVWTQTRFDNTHAEAPLPERLALAFQSGSDNAFVFKLSYRWGPEDRWPRSLFAWARPTATL